MGKRKVYVCMRKYSTRCEMESVSCAFAVTVAVKQWWAQVTQRSLGRALCLELLFFFLGLRLNCSQHAGALLSIHAWPQNARKVNTSMKPWSLGMEILNLQLCLYRVEYFNSRLWQPRVVIRYPGANFCCRNSQQLQAEPTSAILLVTHRMAKVFACMLIIDSTWQFPSQDAALLVITAHL